MKIPKYITVLYPIKVPKGNYCWQHFSPFAICEHFDNEGGHPNCTLDFYPLKNTNDGVIKALECFNFIKLKENK